MTAELPEPLVPAEVDLRDFGYMPLDVRTLMTSTLWIKAKKDPRVAHAAVSLWCECWHQVPAASLPDDDEVLAELARCDEREWRRVRERVLQHFVRCSDGRLYHRHVAKKALESWELKKARIARTKAATEARAARNAERDGKRNEQRHDADNETRDEERHEQRDVKRNVERHVHQGKGIEGKGREGNIYSVPIGTGSGPPPATAVEPVDVIFGQGVPALVAAGVPERNARSMLGLMRKQHGDAAVVRALDRCITERPVEPVAFLQGVLRSPPPSTDRPRASADRLERQAAVIRELTSSSAPQGAIDG